MKNGKKNIKLAILGDSSTQFINMAAKRYFERMGRPAEIFEGGYDQADMLIMDKTSPLYEFAPEYTFIYISSEKLLKAFSGLGADGKEEFAQTTIDRIKGYWHELHGTKIIQANFVLIPQAVYGNQSAKIESSFECQIRKLNVMLADVAAREDVFILDIDTIQTVAGRQNTHNLKQFYMGKVAIGSDYAETVAKNLYDVIAASKGFVRKCVILDLDNTLWGGVIGDDGMENIRLGELGTGRVYTDLQTYFKELKNRGIILCVCSKNDEKTAKEPFESHPDMVLKLEDISVFVANWEDKASNILYIQEVLNIGFDSMVFVDDNPYERGLVKSMLPEVEVVDLPGDPAQYLTYIISRNLFETSSVSKEDSKRTKMYREEAERVKNKSAFTTVGDYLKSLEMKAEADEATDFDMPRVAQLTQRSNQFNLRTKRYTENDIRAMAESGDYKVIKFSLSDKYGSHGLVGVVILKKISADTAFIDTFIMSCRVLKRGMEEYISNKIVDAAGEMGCGKIKAEYLPTEKNALVRDLYENLGYEDAGVGVYELDIVKYVKLDCHISD